MVFFYSKKKIYEQNKKLLFLRGFKILADLMYANNDISVNDLIIKFDYRVKGKSKLNYKILYILLTFIFFRYLQRLMTKFKNY